MELKQLSELTKEDLLILLQEAYQDGKHDAQNEKKAELGEEIEERACPDNRPFCRQWKAVKAEILACM